MGEIDGILNEMDREEKVLVFALGVTQSLVGKGLLSGGVPLSDKGSRAYQALVESGFEPTSVEMAECFDRHFRCVEVRQQCRILSAS